MPQALQIEFLVPGLINASGEPAVGFKVAFFETDGVTPKTVWKAAEMIVGNEAENPFLLDAKGSAVLYGDGHYSIDIINTLGVVIQTLQDFLFIDPSSNIQLFGIDASTFGSGNNADAIAQAILSASGADATVILKSQPWDIDQDLIIPSNIELLYLYGAFTTIQTGITLTISPGVLRAPLFNIFRGPGALILDSKINDRPDIWFAIGTDVDRLFTGIVTIQDTLELNEVRAISPATEVIFKDDVLMEKDLTIIGDLVVDDITMDQITLNKINAVTQNVELNLEITSTSNPLKIKANTTFESTNLNMIFDGRVAGSDNVTNHTFKGAKSVLNDLFSCINFQNFDTSGTSTDITMVRMCGFNDGIDKAGLSLETYDGTALFRRVVVKNDGNVGIGQSLTPQAFLDVQGDAKFGPDTPYENILLEPGTIFAPYNGSFKFQSFTVPVAGTDRFLTHFSDRTVGGGATLHDVSVDGNLGIGTLTPDFKLDIAGDMRIEGGNRVRFGGSGSGDTEVSIGNNATNSLNIDGQLIVNTKIIANDSEITRPTVKIVSTVNVGTLINAAIASFGAGGGIIYLPEGNYLLDVTIVINKSNITIIGDGRDSSIITSDAVLATMINVLASGNNFRIMDTFLDAAGASISALCISSSVNVKDVYIERNRFSGASSSLLTLNVDGLFIKNNSFDLPVISTAMTLVGNDVEISSNKFNDSTGTGAAMILNNIIRIYIFRNEFVGFFDTLLLNNSSLFELDVYENKFDSCTRVVFATGVVSTATFSFYKNEMLQGLGQPITLNTAGNILIENNKFIDQSGGIEIDNANADIRIIHNTFSGITTTGDVINFLTANVTANVFPSVMINHNTFEDISAVDVISIRQGIHSLLLNDTLSINDNTFIDVNLVDAGGGLDAQCIIFFASNFSVDNNKFSNINSDGNLNVILSIAQSQVGSISNNKILGFFIPIGSFNLSGIELKGVNVVNINDNIIIGQNDSTEILIGINADSVLDDGINFRGNIIQMNNSGAGIGNAFNVTTNDGVATGNAVSTSDAQGTLTISAGIVDNNDT